MRNDDSRRKWPIIPTILVLVAVATMIGLGIWQLQRKGEKEAVISRYEAAQGLPSVAWPSMPVPDELPLFRKSLVNCLDVAGWRAVAGTNVRGVAGIKHIAECRTAGAEGPGAIVAIGWSNSLDTPDWNGGVVNGLIVPDKNHLIRLIANEEVAGLQKLRAPSPDSIPNNHLMYAVQWFFFALTALIIYIIALRKRRHSH